MNDEVNSRLEQSEYQVKFLEDDTTIRESNEVAAEVKHLLQSLLLTEDINAYQTGSHARRMMKVYAWKLEMEKIIREVDDSIARNLGVSCKMVHGLEFTAKFLNEGFEDRVVALGPSS